MSYKNCTRIVNYTGCACDDVNIENILTVDWVYMKLLGWVDTKELVKVVECFFWHGEIRINGGVLCVYWTGLACTNLCCEWILRFQFNFRSYEVRGCIVFYGIYGVIDTRIV